MDSPSSFTFSTWFNRRTEVATATNHSVNNVLAAQSSATSNDNFEVGTEGSQVEIYIDAGAGTEFDTTVQVEAGIQNETWHHIVLTYDIADSEGKALRLYVDNQLVQAWDQFKAKLDSSDTSPFSLGLARPSDEKWGQFDGLQDDTALWAVLFHPRRSILCTLTELLIHRLKVLTKLHARLPILLATLLPPAEPSLSQMTLLNRS